MPERRGSLPRQVGPGPTAGGLALAEENKGLVLSSGGPSAAAARTPTGAGARGFLV